MTLKIVEEFLKKSYLVGSAGFTTASNKVGRSYFIQMDNPRTMESQKIYLTIEEYLAGLKLLEKYRKIKEDYKKAKKAERKAKEISKKETDKLPAIENSINDDQIDADDELRDDISDITTCNSSANDISPEEDI